MNQLQLRFVVPLILSRVSGFSPPAKLRTARINSAKVSKNVALLTEARVKAKRTCDV